jgi:hypothetical protein
MIIHLESKSQVIGVNSKRRDWASFFSTGYVKWLGMSFLEEENHLDDTIYNILNLE